MRRLFYISILVLWGTWINPLYACSCAPTQEISFPFKALVQVCGIEAVPDTSALNQSVGGQYLLHFDILENYGGIDVRAVLVLSYHPDLHTGRSSCPLYLHPGEEVLLFARYSTYSDRFVTSYCSPTIRYRAADGRREWGERPMQHRIKKLRRKYLHLGEPFVLEDTIRAYYPNGQVEYVESYRNGLLHGTTYRYYPDGTVYHQEEYACGQRHGVWKHFFGNQTPYLIKKYEQGIEVERIHYKSRTLHKMTHTKYDYERCLRYEKKYRNGILEEKREYPIY